MIVERTFTVAGPVGTVFTYLADFTHTTEWDPGTRSTERTGGDGGLGTTYTNTSEFLGRTVTLAYETVTFEPDEKLQFRGNRGQTYATDTMTFTPLEGDQTEIHYRADFDFGLMINLVAPFFLRRRIEKLADETVEQIRTTIAAL